MALKTFFFFALAFGQDLEPGRTSPNDLCRPADDSQGGCLIDGTNCDGTPDEFLPYNLTIKKWNNDTKTYSKVGLLESHAMVGNKDDWQMYLHGPMIRPTREIEDGSNLPPFYVSATFTHKVYRWDHVQRQGIGQPMKAQRKLVANAVAPSTTYPIEDDEGNLNGVLVAEGQPFAASALLQPGHREFWFGGVDYISKTPSKSDKKCDLLFPNVNDTESHQTRGEVVNTVSCQKDNGICFFSVWNFYDDSGIWPAAHAAGMEDCLHYCVMESMDGSKTGCKFAGVVTDENGEKVCSKKGQGAVHGMTVAHLDKQDPTQFDIFLVFTGGATFDEGESSMKKVRCQKSASGDLVVLKSELFGRDLFEGTVGRPSTYGKADHDVGGDHAWPDESGKYLWVSTFRVGNPGVHMLDYETGELLYSVHGMDSLVPNNYAYSAGIHGIGSLGERGATMVVGTSACTNTGACAPIPYTPLTPERFKAVGIMYVIHLDQILEDVTENVLMV